MSAPNARHFPAQYWTHSPFAKPYVKQILEGCPSGMTTKEFTDAAFRVRVQRTPQLNLAGGFNQTGILALSEHAKGLLAWGQWYVGGRRVCEAAPALALALSKSDPGELNASDVLGERESFYPHFGLDADEAPRVDGRYLLEGAFVLVQPPPSIRITLAARTGDSRQDVAWQGRFDLRLVNSNMDQPAEDAISDAIEAALADIEGGAQRTGPAAQEALEFVAGRVHVNREAFSLAVRFLLNVMAYRRYGEPSGKKIWPKKKTPKSILLKTARGGKEGERARSKLWNLGFLETELIGHSFERVSAPGGTVSMHWRRGHWRNQPHGPQLSLRKLVWIRPAVVNAAGGSA